MKIKEIKGISELNKMKINGVGILPFSFYKGEYYFLYGREAKDINWDERGLWGNFGGSVNKTKETNFEAMIREFWEETNGVFGDKKQIEQYINKNQSKLLIVHSEGYKGVVLFLPIKYSKEIEKSIEITFKFVKDVLENKKNLENSRKRGFLEKDMGKWFNINELKKNMHIFRNCEKELIGYIGQKFTD